LPRRIAPPGVDCLSDGGFAPCRNRDSHAEAIRPPLPAATLLARNFGILNRHGFFPR
jgi:hypothetical protein